jgi:hypothetical protein
VEGVVLCANNGSPFSGVTIHVSGTGCAGFFADSNTTDSTGHWALSMPQCAGSYQACIDTTTLPAGATLNSAACVSFTVPPNPTPDVTVAVISWTVNSSVCGSIPISVVVACPGGKAADGVTVNLFDCANNPIGSGVTGNGGVDGLTVVDISIPTCAKGTFPFNISVCVDPTTLPPGATLAADCQTVSVPSDLGTSGTFDLSGAFCTPPIVAACWETGGGTLDKVRGDVVWTFGGVIYPGCSPIAAGGGNLNIVNHVTGLHFKGTNFVVDDCRGVPTSSPKVTVNIIDWHGTGYVSGDDESKQTPVTFVGTFRDGKESGAGADGLYILVKDLSNNTVFQIGGGPDALDLLTTGNVQIHQSSCGN